MTTSEHPDHYRTLGVQPTASADEIRRAYRILARRYHPDVNPGSHSAHRFAAISAAYEILSDDGRRRTYDAERDSALHFAQAAKRAQTYAENQKLRERSREQKRTASERPIRSPAGGSETPPRVPHPASSSWWRTVRSIGSRFFPAPRRSLAVVEVSLSIREALLGGKKSVELPDASQPGTHRKISLTIPPGSRNGSILQLRSKRERSEELLIIFRVASHPFISIEPRGIVIDLFLTLQEAIQGATLIIPTFDEPVALKIPAFSSSGQEFRLRQKGILQPNGSRGDLFFKIAIKLPDDTIQREKLGQLTADTSRDPHVRTYLPKSFNEIR